MARERLQRVPAARKQTARVAIPEPRSPAALDAGCCRSVREVLLVEYLLNPGALGAEGTALVEHLLADDAELRARKDELEAQIEGSLDEPLAPEIRRLISFPDP